MPQFWRFGVTSNYSTNFDLDSVWSKVFMIFMNISLKTVSHSKWKVWKQMKMWDVLFIWNMFGQTFFLETLFKLCHLTHYSTVVILLSVLFLKWLVYHSVFFVMLFDELLLEWPVWLSVVFWRMFLYWNILLNAIAVVWLFLRV